MLEEQGNSLLTNSAKNLLRFLSRHTGNIIRYSTRKAVTHYSETGKKSVKNLVRKGRDLELTQEIESKEKLKAICSQCKRQNIAFAIKKTENGYQLLYQKKDSSLVNDSLNRVLAKQMKPKSPLNKLLQSYQKIKPQHNRATHTKQREKNSR